ncbi:STAS domain-containing protein [Sphaerisporangium corydalis]|uniref:Anti-sigma factor antagonist n=1 Tax=Sphaerisporangium corydalis TaxID=1441875 RepID=A0ABV9EDV0_9ACTN|nr:STAS domain-containing protein [Sphaerisporangium corydalis]
MPSREHPEQDPPRLRVTVETSPAAVVVGLRGELDMATTPRLAGELGVVYELDHPPRLIFDLSELEFCDSSGLGALVRAYKQVRQADGLLALAGVHGMCERVLLRTGLVRIFTCYPTVADAIAGLPPPPAPPEAT